MLNLLAHRTGLTFVHTAPPLKNVTFSHIFSTEWKSARMTTYFIVFCSILSLSTLTPALRQAVKVFTHFVFPAVKFLSEICSLRKNFSRNNAGIGQLQPYRLDLRQAVKVFIHFVFFLIKLKINEIY